MSLDYADLFDVGHRCVSHRRVKLAFERNILNAAENIVVNERILLRLRAVNGYVNAVPDGDVSFFEKAGIIARVHIGHGYFIGRFRKTVKQFGGVTLARINYPRFGFARFGIR